MLGGKRPQNKYQEYFLIGQLIIEKLLNKKIGNSYTVKSLSRNQLNKKLE